MLPTIDGCLVCLNLAHPFVCPAWANPTCILRVLLPTPLARSRCPPSFPQSRFSRTQEKKRLAYLVCWRKNQMLLGFKIRKNTCLGQWFAHHDSEAFWKLVQMQCEQFMCFPYHPARHFIASTIAGKWLLRSHIAFSWSTNHYVRAFYCPFAP